MSKNIKIAALGIAALGVAALPVAGAWATNFSATHSDKLAITIDEVCTFGNTTPAVAGPAHAVPTEGTHGTWGTAEVGTTNTLSATLTNGAYSENLGSTTLRVYCNDTDGYTITTSFSNGSDEASDANKLLSGSDGIALGSIATSGTIVSAWSFKIDNNGSGATSGAATASTWQTSVGTLVQHETESAGTGDSYTVTYGASVSAGQAAGTYEGTITYTLASIDV